MLKKILILTLSFFFVFGVKVNAQTCDITVNPGESIQQGINQANPGNTVCVLAGEYEERLTINKALVLKGVNGKPTIKDSRPYEWTDRQYNSVVTVENSNNVELSNFTIGESPGRGIILVGTNNSKITDVLVENIFQGGILLLNSSSNNIVKNCEVRDTVLAASPEFYVSGKYWEPALSAIHSSDNNQFINCKVYRTYGEPISAINSEGNTYSNNFIHSNKNMGLYADQAPNTVFVNNFLVNNGSGIHITDEAEYGSISKGEGRVVENNIIVGGTIGLAAWSCDFVDPWRPDWGIDEETCLFKNDVIKNNTFIGTSSNQYGENGIVISDRYYSFINSIVSNNIIITNDQNVLSAPNIAGLSIKDNLWSSTPPGFALEGDSKVISNPSEIFQNSEAINNQNYEVGSVSPQMFCTKSNYNNFGANCNNVGVDLTDRPTITPTPQPTPSISPTFDPKFDLDNNGVVNILDVVEVIKYIFR